MTNEIKLAKTQASVELTLQTSDVVAIGVAKIEENLQSQLRAEEGNYKLAKDKVAKSEAEIVALAKREGEREFSKYVAIYHKLAKAFNYSSGWRQESLENAAKLSIDVEFDHKNQKVTYVATIGSFRTPSQDAKTTVAEVKNWLSLVKDLDAAYKTVMDLRCKLTQIPSFERKIRASLATKTLRSTPEGKAFLKAIEDGVTDVEKFLAE